MISKSSLGAIPTLALASLALAMPALAISAFAISAFATPAFADTIPAITAHHSRHHRAAHRRLASVSPIKPLTPSASPAPADSTAPMPNPGITPPVDNSDQTTSVAPAVMQIHYPPQGDGYVAGSSAQAMDDREAAKVTGVQLKMPLGQ